MCAGLNYGQASGVAGVVKEESWLCSVFFLVLRKSHENTKSNNELSPTVALGDTAVNFYSIPRIPLSSHEYSQRMSINPQLNIVANKCTIHISHFDLSSEDHEFLHKNFMPVRPVAVD